MRNGVDTFSGGPKGRVSLRQFTTALACAVLCVALCGAKGRDAFDGRWVVTVTPDDGGNAYEDTLLFAKGKFVSEGCKAHGFAEAAYEVDVRGVSAQTFTATAKSEKEGSAKWTGTATGPSITGTFIWTKADGSKAEYSFKGARPEK